MTRPVITRTRAEVYRLWIAALQPFSVHVTTLREIADELMQLAGGSIEAKE